MPNQLWLAPLVPRAARRICRRRKRRQRSFSVRVLPRFDEGCRILRQFVGSREEPLSLVADRTDLGSRDGAESRSASDGVRQWMIAFPTLAKIPRWLQF